MAQKRELIEPRQRHKRSLSADHIVRSNHGDRKGW